MPGLVSVKTPPDAPPLHISVPEILPGSSTRPEQQPPPRTPTPKKPPSPSPSRSKPSPARSTKKPPPDSPNPNSLLSDPSLDNPDLGPFLLKLARDTIASGEGPIKALDYAIRASNSFERVAIEKGEEPSLDLVMSLHVLGAIYCSLGRFEEAVPVLERAIKVPDFSKGMDHALAGFSGYMQLGDTYSMLGQVDKSIECYEKGLQIQIESLGEIDPRVGETCRFVGFGFSTVFLNGLFLFSEISLFLKCLFCVKVNFIYSGN